MRSPRCVGGWVCVMAVLWTLSGCGGERPESASPPPASTPPATPDAGDPCAAVTPAELDDGNPCTVDACDAEHGVTHTPLAMGAPCGDGDACNGDETCDGAGACIAGAPPELDDGNACTVDSCDPVTGVSHVAAVMGASCGDGDACNGNEACDGAGVCVPGLPPTLDDGDPCTIDGCDPVAGVLHAPAPAGTPCGDGDPCNGDEACDGLSGCSLVTPLVFDDGDACTLDACDPVLGITHAACSALDPTVATTIANATAFLYSGADPVQIGVAPGTLDVTRAAVIQGRVRARDGAPLPGIAVEVQGHPELGSTKTLADGSFVMAVHGGGTLTVRLEGDGYLRVARQVEVPWQDYARVGDVVMTPYDAQVTSVDLAAGLPASARGSMVADDDGLRQATVLFPAGTSAEMILPGGATVPLTTLSVRATEYTVGDTGPAAMPAALPAASAYTYAVELSVDEAIAAGAMTVQFSHPLPFYVENFLGFPVGARVPFGWYDFPLGAWVPSPDGRVIEIVGIAGNAAEVDTDGDGLADDAATLLALGVTDEERGQLATLYGPGQTLWRVPIEHFTPCDLNWPYGPPPDACKPMDPACSTDSGGSGSSGSGTGSSGTGGSGGEGGAGGMGGNGGDDDDGDGGEGGTDPHHPTPLPDACEESGSVIECENQILGESLPIAGTPFQLHYRSDRVAGRTTAYTLKIPLSRGGVPGSLKRIDLEVEVGGRRFEQQFACPCAANSTTTFSWDGEDMFGRALQGEQPVMVRIGYVYTGVYMESAAASASFGAFSGTPISGNTMREELTLWKVWQGKIGHLAALTQGMGGWTLSPHHAYDPIGRALYLGDGRRRRADAMGGVISTVAGGACPGCALGDGGPAAQASFSTPSGVAVAPDGSVYVSDPGHSRVRRISPDGVISTFAGHGTSGGGGDGGPATQAQLQAPRGLALGRDGSLYIAEQAGRIRRVGPDGIISTIAGTGTSGYGGDGGPAIQAVLNGPFSVAAGADGTLYIADTGNHRIRRMGTDGVITTVAGTGIAGFSGEGAPATAARLRTPRTVAVAPDGSVIVADMDNHRIRRVDTQGIIRTVAGTGAAGAAGDGGLATLAQLTGPTAATVGPEGTIYIADGYGYRLRRVTSDGVITRIAGNPSGGASCCAIREGEPVGGADIGLVGQMHVGPDGALYLAEMHAGANRARRIAPPPMAGVSAGDIVVPSDDGREAYVFNGVGKHQSTVDTRTGATLYQMAYDSAGWLVGVTDVDGNVVVIDRDSAGRPTAITGPFGQTTPLLVNAGGYLEDVTHPVDGLVHLDYGVGGLLTGMTDTLGRVHAYSYDARGRLTHDADPSGGGTTLVRAGGTSGHSVTLTSALGRATTYHLQTLASGGQSRTIDLASGLSGSAVGGAGGPTTITRPDGVTTTWAPGPDPRFGMLSSFAKTEVRTTPGGKTLSIARSRAATLSNPADVMSFTTITETTTINGKSFQEVFNKAPRTMVRTTPDGRQTTTTLDTRGRLVKIEIPGMLPVDLSYDAHGRLEAVNQGARTLTRGYGLEGYLASLVDPLLQTTSFLTDAAGRVLTETRPDGEEVLFDYDAAGNRESITPPGRPSHLFGFTPVDLVALYSPPDLNVGGVATPTPTVWGFDLDRKTESVARPGGASISYGYDGAGRRTSVSFPGGVITRGYSPTTGKLVSVAGPAGVTLTYAYDGSLLTGMTWSGAIAGAVHRVFNNDHRVTSESVNGGGAVSFGYDNDGLLVSAGGMTLARDAQNGRLTGTSLGSVAETVSYSGFGEIAQREAKVGASTVLLVVYVRDGLGRIVERTETIESVTHVHGYAYDAAGRLEDVFYNGVLAAHYDLDANGNRLSRTTPGGSETATYDDQDRLLSYGAKTYAYQDSGELLSRMDTATGETTVYEYDALGGLRSVTLPGGLAIEYLVDGTGRRVGKKVGGSLVQGWMYQDALRPAAELDGTGAVVARFVYGDRVNVPDLMIQGGATYRILTDELGSVRLVVDVATGAVAQRMDYDEFGRVTLDTSPGFQPFGFAGGLYDADTGLVRFGARDYDAEVGRWTAKDPLLFDGGDTNLYAYAGNDPVNLQDPWGEKVARKGICAAFARYLPGCVCEGTCPYPLPGGPPPPWVPAPRKPPVRIGICPDEPPVSEDERERCRRVMNACIDECEPHLGGGSREDFHNCLRKCRERAGCWKATL